jgi:hypothetical protein
VEFQKRGLPHAHFFANHGGTLQDHVPRAVWPSHLCRAPKQEEVSGLV